MTSSERNLKQASQYLNPRKQWSSHQRVSLYEASSTSHQHLICRVQTELDMTRASKVVTCLNTHQSWEPCLTRQTARTPLHLTMWWIKNRWTLATKRQKILTHFVLKGTVPPHLSDSWIKLKQKDTWNRLVLDWDRWHFQSRKRIQDKNWQRIREAPGLI